MLLFFSSSTFFVLFVVVSFKGPDFVYMLRYILREFSIAMVHILLLFGSDFCVAFFLFFSLSDSLTLSLLMSVVALHVHSDKK